MQFDSITSIQQAGFEGFITVGELRDRKYKPIPRENGVYLILRTETSVPEFSKISTAFNKDIERRDPTVSLEELEKKWIDNALVVYIGKAGKLASTSKRRSTLHARLRVYIRYGMGKNVTHEGGRYIWQLPNPFDLLVCWKPTPQKEPRDVESALIQEFRTQYGNFPFANLAK